MILCSGCFDGLHVGHLWYLEQAANCRAQKDETIYIGVAPDEYIRHSKGREPRWPLRDRLAAISLLHYGCALEHSEQGVANLIRELKPRLFVKGDGWRHMLAADVRHACSDVSARIIFVPSYPCKSSREAFA